ncbi:type IV secretory system conjugative DNA transfer family protein [Puerhibacterium puerhi]|uniref:type IV secretory system conjugative DNA transfer family protein n=1 Tax=Puerhibacterium puerhi TaxID=2692623 RepID=UPI001357DF23|nr:TraM recognition domain-containing protein [Puerhibacterium puerhi]
MPRERNRRPEPAGNDTGWLVLGGVLVFGLVVVAALWAGARLNPAFAHTTDPVVMLGDVVTGRVPMTGAQAAVTFGSIVAALAVAGLLVFAGLRVRGAGSRVDYKARWLASGRDVAALTAPQAAKDAARLGATGAGVGVTLGTHLPSRQALYASWEWVQVWLMGPRAGKTSCVCIPQVLETTGPVLATTNKPDLPEATRGPRSELGVTYLHDPQGIVGAEPTFWWDPLSFVTDMETAERLADVFISSATSAGAKQDAYFESAGKELLSRLLLAAALDRRPITDVFTWANDPDSTHSDNPAAVLNKHGETANAVALERTQTLTEKQRDGVYGTVRPWIGVLGSSKIAPWITDPTGARPHFDPHRFVRSSDTLYLVSKEGGGSARAITAALTMAVLTAAEQAGAASPGGRLPVPLTVVLDEVANVCRWRELPDVYSHYGSRGIVVSSFFQSWAQGVEAFGETGMQKLWSAANVRVVGSGLSEDKFLPFVSGLIGDHDVVKRSATQQKGGRSVSTSVQRQRIFEVSDLTALPQGRALLMGSGLPPALLRLDHFSARPYAGKVAESSRYYESQRERRARWEAA